MCVTYSDLIQLSIFIVALVGLCYEIFKDKRKQPPHLAHVTAARQGSKSLFGVSRLRFPFLYLQYSISKYILQVYTLLFGSKKGISDDFEKCRGYLGEEIKLLSIPLRLIIHDAPQLLQKNCIKDNTTIFIYSKVSFSGTFIKA